MTIRIGILGYGNLGKGVECAIKHNPDIGKMEIATLNKERRGEQYDDQNRNYGLWKSWTRR